MKKYKSILLLAGVYVIGGVLCWLNGYLSKLATQTFSIWLLTVSKLAFAVIFLIAGIVLAIVLLNKQEQSKVVKIIENILCFAPAIVLLIGIVLYFTPLYIVAPFSVQYLGWFSLSLLIAGAKLAKILLVKEK